MKPTKINSLILLVLICGSEFLVGNTEKKIGNRLGPGVISQQTGFKENKGQILSYDGLPQPSVKFVFQQGNTQLFLLERGIAYQFTKSDYPKGYTDLIKIKSSLRDFAKLYELQKQVRIETFRMDMTLAGANINGSITTEGKSVDYTNYYNRNVLDVRSYTKITYHEIYPGIDWVVYSNAGRVKYDFIVKPGADPSLIKMEFKHHEDLALNTDGSFTLKNRLGNITEEKPISFQEKRQISTKFRADGNSISFIIANYDHTKPLIIDPSLIWGTYYGGSSGDFGSWCTVDALGNVFLAGGTESSLNIASGGHQVLFGGDMDAFLVKFDANGLRQWASYYGGSNSDAANYCAVDMAGNVFLAGSTTSTSNIASSGHQNAYGGGNSDSYLVKFSSGGVRLWGTYYGGTEEDYGFSCSMDGLGNVYLGGFTNSTLNIASSGFQNTIGGMNDAYLVKFNSNGVRQWGTYYGGTNDEYAFSCMSDGTGNIYLCGSSASGSNISSGGFQNTYGGGLNDAFLVKFDANCVRLWATYYGDTGTDNGYFCTTDALNNVYLGGDTDSPTNIASGGHQNVYGGGSNDSYLVKFDVGGNRVWATYYGGIGNEPAYSCSADVSNNIYVTGVTSSTSNIAFGGYQNSIGGSDDAFVVKFNGSGARLWGTYYGGTGFDSGSNSVVDLWGNIHLCGSTNSPINIAFGGHQNTYGGGSSDAFLVKFCDIPPGQPSSIIGNSPVCSKSLQTYSVNSVPGITSYSWSAPAGWTGTSSSNSIALVPASSGTLVVSAINTCGNSSSQTLNVTVNQSPTVSVTSSSSTVCKNESVTVTASGANSYTWSFGGNNTTTIIAPVTTTTYNVIGKDQVGCVDTTLFLISVNPSPIISISSMNGLICTGENATITAVGALTYTWDSEGNNNVIVTTPTITTNYNVMGFNQFGCRDTASFMVVVTPCSGVSEKPGNIEINIYPNPNQGFLNIESPSYKNVTLSIYNVLGEEILNTSITQDVLSLDISHFVNGMYLFVFRQDNEILKRMNIVKK